MVSEGQATQDSQGHHKGLDFRLNEGKAPEIWLSFSQCWFVLIAWCCLLFVYRPHLVLVK